MCLSTAFPQHCNHTYAAVCCCVVFLLWELFMLLWDHMDRLKEETHGTDSQPGSRHRFISSQLMFIKPRLCARQWVGTDQSSSVSALKIFSAHNVLEASGYLWVEYFCINEVFPDTSVARRMRDPVGPFLEESKPKSTRLWPVGPSDGSSRRRLHCKWLRFPDCGNKQCMSVSCIPYEDHMEENASLKPFQRDLPMGPLQRQFTKS